ncbi:MAG: hypothetical protein ACTSRA_00685 [Promethearchaeota archaeon]|nr:MAG: hypothetical protein [Helarchaeota virus Nidhogg Meg22_1012]URC17474.1 MAG: hypothetical protein [Helarchaeota virus Nidhogg Meg22_1214]
MGERAAYRVRDGLAFSHMMRKQWYQGGDKESLKSLIERVICTLNGGALGVGSMIFGSALRPDLDIRRLTAAMYNVLYDPPFDSIEYDYNCDIRDHGLFELEILEWNVWAINHYDIQTDDIYDKKRLVLVKIENGMPEFEWADDFVVY